MSSKSSNRAVLLVMLSAIGVVMAFPFFWMLVTSLQPVSAVYEYPPQFLPAEPTLSNFREVLIRHEFVRYTSNSLFVSVIASLGALLTCSMAGFAFARMRFPGRDLVFALIIATLLVPHEVVIIPEFILMNRIGWVNSYLPLIVPSFLVGATGTFLMRSFYETVPKSLEEAAVIDGAGAWQIYIRVFLPLARSALSALFIVVFLINWNSLLRPLVYLHDQSLYTLPLGLASFQGQYMAQQNLLLAGAMISVGPILLVFLIMQKQFIEGLTSSGLKG